MEIMVELPPVWDLKQGVYENELTKQIEHPF
jgi:hypothetical protein